jgi:nucleoid-associated protein YgaU
MREGKMTNIRLGVVLLFSAMFLSGCVTTQTGKEPVRTKEEIIEMQLKQTLAIAETSLEVSKNAEKLAQESLEKSRQAETSSGKAIDTANAAVESANEARKFVEQEVDKAIKAADEAKKFATQESEKAINAANRASKLAMDHADQSAEKAIKAANDAIQASNASSEKSIAVANQTMAELGRMRAATAMKPAEEPIIMQEPSIERTYRIKSGDTLSGISRKFYGDSSRWRMIYERNRKVLGNPNRIPVGAKIIIP